MSFRFPFALLLLSLLASCARSPLDDAWLPPRPLAAGVPAHRPPQLPDDAHPTALPAPAINPTGELTLGQVWQLALLHHPALAADAWEVRAAEARQMQADVMPNPQLDVRLDDFGGSGDRQSFDEANLRVRITQLIELGDKRQRRVNLAQAGRTLAAWDYEARRVAIAADVTDRFVTVLELQQRIALGETTVQTLTRLHQLIEDRIEAGAKVGTDLDQSKARLAFAKIDLSEARIRLEAARRQLANTWNNDKPAFTHVVGPLDITGEQVPGIDDLIAMLDEHPDVARFAGEIAHRQAQLELARAGAVPDVRVGAGARYFRENDEQAFLLEVEIPLPLFDRRQGDILEKRFAVASARSQAAAARTQARSALIGAHRDMTIAHDRAATLERDIIPGLKTALETTQTQFNQGVLKLNDLHSAHRDLLRAQSDHLRALGDYHQAAARVEGLTGRPLR